MTSISGAAAPLLPSSDLNAPPAKSAIDSGLRTVGFDENSSLQQSLQDKLAAAIEGRRDRVELSDEAKAKMGIREIMAALDAQNSRKLSEILAKSAERSAKSAKIKALADQLYAEVHAQKGSYVEPTPYAIIRDKDGREVGKIGQGGGISLDGDWAAQKDASEILELIRNTLSASEDDQATKRLLFHKLKDALGDLGSIALTGVDVVPPKFGDEKLHRIWDELNATLSGE